MKVVACLLLLFFSLCLCSCRKDDGIVEPETSRPVIKSVLPERARVGDVIKIVLFEPVANYNMTGEIYFNGCWNRIDSAKADTIFTFVPYIPNAPEDWKVRFGLWRRDSVFQAEWRLKVETESASRPVEIKWNNNDPVTEKEALFYHPDRYVWKGEKRNDTINLIRRYPASESYGEYILRFLDKGPGKLPTLISAVMIYYPDYGPFEENTRRDTISPALIKIDKWEPGNIVSGRIFPQVGEYKSGGFTYLKSAEPFLDKYAFYCVFR